MKSISKERWAELDLKTRIAYVTATVAFGLGWGLTIASFIVPPLGIVSDSVLWILGQSLVYAASVLGVGMYVSGSVKGMKREISRFMRAEKAQDKAFEEDIEEETEEE